MPTMLREMKDEANTDQNVESDDTVQSTRDPQLQTQIRKLYVLKHLIRRPIHSMCLFHLLDNLSSERAGPCTRQKIE